VTRLGARVAAALFLLVLACKKPVKPGDPLPDLTGDQLARFTRGKVVFDSVFTPHTGLGPLFNSNSCGECHEDPVAGGTGDEVEVHATLFKGGMCDPLVQEGGPVIQQHTTPALKAKLGIDREPFPPSANARASRTTPVVFARGLMDLVPDSAILAYADSEDRNHDGVHGRPNHSVDGRIGRFGRKAFVPTLADFNAGAFVAEMGITNPAQPTEENIGGKPIPPGVDSTADPEITQEQLDVTDDFVRFLAAPTPAKLGRDGRRGRDLFSKIGCTGCHIPTLRTGASPIQALNRREFAAYTDLLIHDMGQDLADICLGQAAPADFRTEPLLGLRDVKRFLHDGRAATIDQAIELHGGEGSGARDRFKALTAEDRAAVVAFLTSL